MSEKTFKVTQNILHPTLFQIDIEGFDLINEYNTSASIKKIGNVYQVNVIYNSYLVDNVDIIYNFLTENEGKPFNVGINLHSREGDVIRKYSFNESYKFNEDTRLDYSNSYGTVTYNISFIVDEKNVLIEKNTK